MFRSRFNFIPQYDQMDCGPACLSMIARFYGKKYSLKYLREKSFLSREGVSILGISEAAKTIGFESSSLKISYTHLIANKIPPSIIYWNKNHFVVLQKVSKNIVTKKYYFHIADPGHGMIRLNADDFKKSWISNDDEGVIILLSPTDKFYKSQEPEKQRLGMKYLFSFMTPYRKELLYLCMGLLTSSFISLTFPFLTQSLIDKGINARSENIVFIILLAQIFLPR